MKKMLVWILAVIVLSTIVWFIQPFGVKANKKTTDQCTKDMQKYENVICD